MRDLKTTPAVQEVLEYITENEGCDLIMIFDELRKKKHESTVIVGSISELERKGTIELITDNGYHLKK